jgi:hypothetical protein
MVEALCEQLILQRYALCVLVPEGDYTWLETLPGVIVQPLSGAGVSIVELVRVVRHSDLSVSNAPDRLRRAIADRYVGGSA